MTAAHACPPEHRHAASSTCYKQHACRCLPCRVANSNRVTQQSKRTAYGRPSPRVPAGPTREHLATLRAAGIGMRRICDLTGLSRTTLQVILRGRSSTGPRAGEQWHTVGRDVEARVLAIAPTIDSVAGAAIVPARGAHRRLQALVTAGWSVARLAARIDMTTSNLWSVLAEPQMTATMHRRIVELHDTLASTPPPETTKHERASVTRARRYAAEHGWQPTLAWDDIDHDTAPPAPTDEVVDDLAIELLAAGHDVALTRTERVHAAAHLTALGRTQQQIGEALGVDPRQVLRYLAEHRTQHPEEATA